MHLCGEPAAIDICRKLLDPIGEHVEVETHERKAPYTISTHALGSLRNIDDGDCVVCFSRPELLSVAKMLEKTARHVCDCLWCTASRNEIGSVCPIQRSRRPSECVGCNGRNRHGSQFEHQEVSSFVDSVSTNPNFQNYLQFTAPISRLNTHPKLSRFANCWTRWPIWVCVCGRSCKFCLIINNIFNVCRSRHCETKTWAFSPTF